MGGKEVPQSFNLMSPLERRHSPPTSTTSSTGRSIKSWSKRQQVKELVTGQSVGQEDVPVPSTTNAQQTVEVEKEKVQFDFAQVTPHKKRVKHRNIMGEDGQVLDVTDMDEEEIKKMISQQIPNPE